MTNIELKALRQLLALECSEAAEHIGNVSTRSWQRWEDGSRPVPDDAAIKINYYAQIRNSLIDRQIENAKHNKDAKIDLRFYLSVDEYQQTSGDQQRDVVMWKITNSVAGHCFSAGIANLI
ncbi:DUF1870 family protein [Serratia marcescens]|nr:DUF1870 family protein [Serratia marcescens]